GDVSRPSRGHQRRQPHGRDFRSGAKDRGFHRPDAALRYYRAGANGPNRPGPWPREIRSGVMTTGSKVPYTTRPIPADVLARLTQLRPGQRLRITQRVKIGSTKTWHFSVEGTFR